MKSFNKLFAIAALSSAAVALPFSFNANADNMDAENFVKMCDTDKDGMVSKAEMMKHVEKMWDKVDTKKMGKIDKKQAEIFLKEFAKISGG